MANEAIRVQHFRVEEFNRATTVPVREGRRYQTLALAIRKLYLILTIWLSYQQIGSVKMTNVTSTPLGESDVDGLDPATPGGWGDYPLDSNRGGT